MAYYNNQNQDEEEKDNSQGMNATAAPAAPTDAPVQLSNQSSVVSNVAAPQAPKTAKPASSGAAPSFQSYTKANQGTAQNKLNTAATSAVANAGQTANTALNQATDQFGKKVDSGSLLNSDGTVSTREQALKDVSNTISSARSLKAPAPTPAAPQAALATPGTTAAAALAAPALPPVEGLDQFQKIINAQYQGPESLRQSGLYNNAAAKVDSATNLINNSKTATGREEMLKNMYAKRADYTSGLNKLDSALLNSNKQGVQALQNTAQAQGDLSQALDKAQVNSATLASNRTNDINDIRNQSKTLFNTEKAAEEQKTEDRLDAMIKTPLTNPDGSVIMKADGTPMTQWDQLPEHFKDVIRNSRDNNAKSLADETAKLGPAFDASSLTRAQQALQAAQVNKMSGNITYGFNQDGGTQEDFDARQAQWDKEYQDAQANYDRLNGQSQAYNSQLSALKQKYNPNAVNFNDLEAKTLGLNAGEGLYNAGADIIKQGTANRDQLISKDEQYRQAALAQLAGLDGSNYLNTNLKYADADKAGTQTILDSLNTKGTRDAINEKEATFQKSALDNNITGSGMKKEKTSGNKYYATDSANLADVLKSNGYKFGGDPTANTANINALGNVNGNMSSLNDANSIVGGAGSAQMNGYTGGDSNTVVGQAGNIVGSALFGNTITGGLGLGGVGDTIDKFFGGGANVGAAKDQARINAREDLNKNLQTALNTAGFDNRVNIDNSQVSQDRKTALENLMNSFDKTNYKG